MKRDSLGIIIIPFIIVSLLLIASIYLAGVFYVYSSLMFYLMPVLFFVISYYFSALFFKRVQAGDKISNLDEVLLSTACLALVLVGGISDMVYIVLLSLVFAAAYKVFFIYGNKLGQYDLHRSRPIVYIGSFIAVLSFYLFYESGDGWLMLTMIYLFTYLTASSIFCDSSGDKKHIIYFFSVIQGLMVIQLFFVLSLFTDMPILLKSLSVILGIYFIDQVFGAIKDSNRNSDFNEV